MIGLNDFKSQWHLIKNEVMDAVCEMGESGWLILGDNVATFEKTISQRLQANYCVGCASGLDAIEIALRVLGIGEGDGVLTTPLSAFATTLAIMKVGAKPIFVDVDERGLLDLNLCEQRLLKNNEIKCLLPVHLYGQPLNLKRCAELKEIHNIYLIEDCAQAICATYQGVNVGTVSDMAAFSLYPTKNLGCYGDGGFLIAQQNDLAAMAKSLRDYGQTQKYEHTHMGLNSRLDELQAAILNKALLPRLDEFTKRRKQIANMYLEGIRHPAIRLPTLNAQSEGVWHLFPVLCEDRQGLQNFLKDKNIQTGVHYPLLITEQKALQNYPHGFEVFGTLNNAKMYAQQELSLPIHPLLTDDQVETIVTQCNRWKA